MQRQYSVVKLATEVAETWGTLSAIHIRKSLEAKTKSSKELHAHDAVRCAVEAAHHAIRAQIYRERGL